MLNYLSMTKYVIVFNICQRMSYLFLEYFDLDEDRIMTLCVIVIVGFDIEPFSIQLRVFKPG